MNTPSPLVPQGTSPSKNKSTIRIAFFTILIVHVVFIGGLLIQGCTKDSTPATDSSTNAPKTNASETLPQTDNLANTTTPSDPTAAIPSATATTTAPVPTAVPAGTPVTANATTGATAPLITPPATTGATHEYTIQRGDMLASIAKKNGVSLKALQEANPGVNALRLQVGQKLQIPAGTAAAVASTSTGSSADTATTDTGVYTVKSGDRLERIAKSHGTTVKAIASLNGLKSINSLKVGQKLKLPMAKAASTDAIPAATAPAPAASSTPTTTAQVTTGTANN
jgi:LysM repeat protein